MKRLATLFIVLGVTQTVAQENSDSKLGDVDKVPKNWFKKASESQQLYRLEDLDDPKIGFVYNQVSNETGEVRAVFVTCNEDVIVVSTSELREDPGECGKNSVSTVNVTYDSLIQAIDNKRAFAIDPNDREETLKISDVLISEHGAFAGVLVQSAEQDGGKFQRYVSSENAQFVATVEDDIMSVGVLPFGYEVEVTSPVELEFKNLSTLKSNQNEIPGFSYSDVIGEAPIAKSYSGQPFTTTFPSMN